MCGITGYVKKSNTAPNLAASLEEAVNSLNRRGPDHQATFEKDHVGLGHARLSIIDTSSKAHQPMTDNSGRYTLVYNGEIYNYKELAKELDHPLTSSSDTEVLLYLLIKEGKKCLERLNGFFAFAFYDNEKESLLLARDRMGIKPLHYYQDEDYIVFGSELKALLSFPIPRTLNQKSLYWYLRLTYLPLEMSLIKGVKKLLPGHYISIKNREVVIDSYFTLQKHISFPGDYAHAKKKVVELLAHSVERRMVSDVPLGAFLSGGTDSSAVVSMASKFNTHLNTFSIGYKDHPFFDETNYAELVANRFQTNHTTFSLTNDDLLSSIHDVIDYIDEPFADSSSIPTFILAKKVSQSMKVALSGDGADELFGGYYKHLAFQKLSSNTLSTKTINALHPLLRVLPKSRSSTFGNTIRRLHKFSELSVLSQSEQYWRLASFNTNAISLLLDPINGITEFQNHLLASDTFDLNTFLDADLKMVLPGDMLTKVDLMSMANSLEVRVPFLDKELVAFARSLPEGFKVRGNQRKRVLQDAFEHILPKELHHRSKKGFEVPLLHWLRNELYDDLKRTVFDEGFIKHQKLFDHRAILQLRSRLQSGNPGDVHAILWTLYVFQKWYKRYLA